MFSNLLRAAAGPAEAEGPASVPPSEDLDTRDQCPDPQDIAADSIPSIQPVPAESDPPIAEIGFGPGMVIRLSQIGVRSVSDLARSDIGELRQALGDISRLVDIEGWLQTARSHVAKSEAQG